MVLMTPEEIIYAVIKDVTANVFPTQPDENIPPPYLVYTAWQSAEELDGLNVKLDAL